MQKIATILAAVALLFNTSLFAASDSENVPPKIKAAFDKNFSTASNVTWEKSNSGYSAFFKLYDMSVKADYDEAGKLIRSSRTLNLTQLPLSIVTALSGKYSKYSISPNVIEENSDGETSYFIVAQNGKGTMRLKCSCGGNIEEEKMN